MLGKFRQNGKILGISWENLKKMLVNCRRNVGKILGKY